MSKNNEEHFSLNSAVSSSSGDSSLRRRTRFFQCQTRNIQYVLIPRLVASHGCNQMVCKNDEEPFSLNSAVSLSLGDSSLRRSTRFFQGQTRNIQYVPIPRVVASHICNQMVRKSDKEHFSWNSAVSSSSGDSSLRRRTRFFQGQTRNIQCVPIPRVVASHVCNQMVCKNDEEQFSLNSAVSSSSGDSSLRRRTPFLRYALLVYKTCFMFLKG